jgi:hypothetical protein
LAFLASVGGPWHVDHHHHEDEVIMYSLLVARALINAFKATARSIDELRIVTDAWAASVREKRARERDA